MSQSAHYQAVLSATGHAGVYHMPQIDPAVLAAAGQALGFAVFRVDLATAQTKDDLLGGIAQAMSFPDWFGRGFDALADCLADLAWAPAEGYLVLLEHCDGIHGRAESEFVATLEIFERAADEWREQGTPFWCFVDMQADGINWLADVP